MSESGGIYSMHVLRSTHGDEREGTVEHYEKEDTKRHTDEMGVFCILSIVGFSRRTYPVAFGMSRACPLAMGKASRKARACSVSKIL